MKSPDSRTLIFSLMSSRNHRTARPDSGIVVDTTRTMYPWLPCHTEKSKITAQSCYLASLPHF